MKICLLLLAFVVAVAIGQEPQSLGLSFAGDDIERLVKQLQAGLAPKTEFETTAEYGARRNLLKKDGTTIVVVPDVAIPASSFTYDADSQVMTYNIFFKEARPPQRTAIPVIRIRRSHRQYEGSNAYGAKAIISSSIYDQFNVAPVTAVPHSVLIPLPIAVAKDTKSFLRVALECSVAGGPIETDVEGFKPTVSDPVEIYINHFSLPVSVRKFVVFDNRTGNVLYTWSPDSSSDSLDQKKITQAVFPLELQISGSGMVDVSVDDGPPTMKFASATSPASSVRAKHKIYLKITSSQSGLTFVVNGHRLIPAWSYTNFHQIGSMAFFERADFTITDTMLSFPTQGSLHKIGESIQDWTSLLQLDLKAICKENKPACKNLQNIEHKGNGTFWTTDNIGRATQWVFAGGKITAIKTQ